METWIWRQFELEHPEDWEMLQYGRRDDAGRCAFADRYQYRLEFNWRKFDGTPDWERTLSDYRSKLQTDHPDAKLRPVKSANWSGLDMHDGKVRTSRFGRFFAQSGCLVEMVFIWPDRKDADLSRRVLESVYPRPARNGRVRWRAFGMDLRADESLALKRCEVEPARAELHFATDQKHSPTESYHRLGMVDQWLKGSVADWLELRAPADLVGARPGRILRNDHHVAHLEGTLKQGHMRRVFRAPFRYTSAAWRCPNDGRLYCVTRTFASRQSEDVDASAPAGRRLTCCDQLARFD